MRKKSRRSNIQPKSDYNSLFSAVNFRVLRCIGIFDYKNSAHALAISRDTVYLRLICQQTQIHIQIINGGVNNVYFELKLNAYLFSPVCLNILAFLT